MTLVLGYDGTFAGFLTCIFECYNRKIFPVDIFPQDREQARLFSQKMEIISDLQKAERVWKGIQEKLSRKNKNLVFYAYLSEEQGIEMKIYRFLRRLFSGHFHIETDFGDPDVIQLVQVSQMVKREAMHVMQFTRFQHTRDDFWFCGIEPRYDVLLLVTDHFRKRFAGQKWLLYDLKRNYGMYYDLDKVEEVTVTTQEFSKYNGRTADHVAEEGEVTYQNLWKTYFKQINIAERKNLRLQRQHMPHRFWKFLTEKQD